MKNSKLRSAVRSIGGVYVDLVSRLKVEGVSPDTAAHCGLALVEALVLADRPSGEEEDDTEEDDEWQAPPKG